MTQISVNNNVFVTVSRLFILYLLYTSANALRKDMKIKVKDSENRKLDASDIRFPVHLVRNYLCTFSTHTQPTIQNIP